MKKNKTSFVYAQTLGRDQCAETPKKLLVQVYNDFKLQWDPCPATFITDAFSYTWKKDGAFINPPFNDIKKWVHKAVNDNIYTLFLFPFSKLHRKYFQPYWQYVKEIYVCTSLIKFKRYTQKPLNESIAFVTFGPNTIKPIKTPFCKTYMLTNIGELTFQYVAKILKTLNRDTQIIISEAHKHYPKLLQNKKSLILGLQRLDLKFIRSHLSLINEIFILPKLKYVTAGDCKKCGNKHPIAHRCQNSPNNFFIQAGIILNPGIAIAKDIAQLELNLHPHHVPTYQYVNMS